MILPPPNITVSINFCANVVPRFFKRESLSNAQIFQFLLHLSIFPKFSKWFRYILMIKIDLTRHFYVSSIAMFNYHRERDLCWHLSSLIIVLFVKIIHDAFTSSRISLWVAIAFSWICHWIILIDLWESLRGATSLDLFSTFFNYLYLAMRELIVAKKTSSVNKNPFIPRP